MTTYTVISGSGVVKAEGLSANDAAREILTHDGHNYEIRPDADGGFWLWHTQRGGGGNVPMVRTLIYSAADTEDEAQDQIFAEVVKKSDWFDHQDVMTDADYATMVAEAVEAEAE